MRVVVQRVLEASVVVSNTAVAVISKGLLVLLGCAYRYPRRHRLVGKKNKPT